VETIKSRQSALATDIKLWRKAQVAVLPQLHDKIVNAKNASEPEQDTLFLPSDIDLDDHQELGLEAAAEHEFHLREGQANDAVKDICNSVMHSMVLREEKRERARGVSQNTRALKQIYTVREKKTMYISKYRFARDQILKLKGNDPSVMEDYPELKDEDTYAKNAASSRKLGDGKSVDSWIWSFGKLKGLNEEEKADFIRDSEFSVVDSFLARALTRHLAEKVQWFRAQADMERWVEEVELLEEDFRRLVRGCQTMDRVWTSLSNSTVSPRYVDPTIPSTIAIIPSNGHRAYALQKAAMFRKMAVISNRALTDAGGGWPGEGETLSQYVWRKRPQITVDWATVEAETVTDSAKS
jgi:hypothetical protein